VTKFEDLFALTSIVGPIFAENSYLLQKRGSQEALVIDPGFQAEEVLDLLDKQQLRCDLVLITHGHVDHVNGVPLFRRRGIEVRMHPADQAILNVTLNIPGVTEDPVEIEGQLDEGIFEWHGIPIEVIHTPGHSPGSVSLLIGGVLFSGDTLFRRSVGRTDLPGSSWKELEESIRTKLYTLPAEVAVYSGHGDPTAVGEEAAENPFVPARSDAFPH
jgi:glyoxylase-like metal-dependent hydrolase (beta-lactamase superfamily II)